MLKLDFIIVFFAFITFIVIFHLTASPDVLIPEERIETAISDVLENETQYDKNELQQIVMKIIELLNEGQSRRIKYLVTAYFVVWLILMFYLFWLKQKYTYLHEQIQQLESVSDQSRPE